MVKDRTKNIVTFRTSRRSSWSKTVKNYIPILVKNTQLKRKFGKTSKNFPLCQTPKTSNTSQSCAARIGEQSKTPPLFHKRAVQHASRAVTKSISSKPLLDANRRSNSATSIQNKSRLVSAHAKTGKSSDDPLKNGTFNQNKIRKTEVKIQQRPLNFTSRGK